MPAIKNGRIFSPIPSASAHLRVPHGSTARTCHKKPKLLIFLYVFLPRALLRQLTDHFIKNIVDCFCFLRVKLNTASNLFGNMNGFFF